MDKKNLVVIFAVAVVVVISAGWLMAGLEPSFDSPPRSELTSSTPAALRAPTVTATGTSAALQSPAVPVNRSIPAVTTEQAGYLARDAFPGFDPDRVNITYYPGDKTRQSSFEFDLLKENERLVQGGLDPETGALVWYAIPIKRIGRAADPVITIDTARTAAEKEIRNREGSLSLNLSEERYDLLGMPDSGVAGVYVFVYDRLKKGDRCDSDGFTIGVDSLSGKVIEYRKTWIQPPGSIC
ncbi:hypothetical protein [Methanoregula sp.]|uniref:hypothetical protein n=1 Tax=Methanoregula sp. TaxID=2052170 RepID=UPI000CAAC179|nr:hypothetical protein [Methanoregula sp.]PKG32086.1 MAG: hypothetical protein CW742_10005 [Methanoregula sp.]